MVEDNKSTFEMYKIHKNSTLSFIGVEGYSSAPVASLSSQSNSSRSESKTLQGADVFCAKAKWLDAHQQESG